MTAERNTQGRPWKVEQPGITTRARSFAFQSAVVQEVQRLLFGNPEPVVVTRPDGSTVTITREETQ